MPGYDGLDNEIAKSLMYVVRVSLAVPTVVFIYNVNVFLNQGDIMYIAVPHNEIDTCVRLGPAKVTAEVLLTRLI